MKEDSSEESESNNEFGFFYHLVTLLKLKYYVGTENLKEVLRIMENSSTIKKSIY